MKKEAQIKAGVCTTFAMRKARVSTCTKNIFTLFLLEITEKSFKTAFFLHNLGFHTSTHNLEKVSN